MKGKCSQEHLTPPKEGVREPKPLKKVPPESEERNWVDCAKVSCHSQPLNLDSRFLSLCQNSGISSKYCTEISLVNPKNRRLEHPTPCKGLKSSDMSPAKMR